MVLLISIAAVVLFVLQYALLRVSLGLGVLGILAGLLIVTVISVLAFQALRKGPVPTLGDEAPKAAPRRRPPPGGLR